MVLFRQLVFAWRMLSHNIPRFVLSILGIAFACLIMFMELGFFNGLNDSQANLPPFLSCDLVMSHPEKNHLKTGEEFHRLRFQQVKGLPGVETASPLYSSGNYWWNPENGSRYRVLILGVDLEHPLLAFPELEEFKEALRRPYTILYDRLSRAELGTIRPGTTSRLVSPQVEVVGLFELGPNFSYEGHILTSKETFFQLFPGSEEGVRDRLDLGLIRLEPGLDPEVARKRILESLPNDFILLTPQEIYRREIRVTTRRSPSGIVFGIGLIVGFCIGVIICYQILFNEISDNLPQFATAKAMGYQKAHLFGIVIATALLLSCIGFVPGLAGSLGLYWLVKDWTQINMFMTSYRIGLVFLMTTGMCLLAAFLALKSVIRADPADLF